VVGGLGAMAAAVGGLVGLVASPAGRTATRRWRAVMPAADVGTGAPVQAVIAERTADGWYQTRRQSVVYVDREGDAVRALSATCSHLGCTVRWDGAGGQFRCPCHGGTYDRSGAVIAGPPPRPLERLNARINPETSEIEVEL
jgi:Rieske Fe-S protein